MRREVTLDKRLIDFALEAAEKRELVERRGELGRRRSPISHRIGALAEVAAAVHYGERPYLHVGSGDDGVDFRMWVGAREWTVNVKGVTYDPPVLKVQPRDLQPGHDAEIYMLALVDPTAFKVWLCGYATYAEVKAAPLKPYRQGLPSSHNIEEKNLRECRSHDG